jgi:hypothetical protein
LAQVAPPQSRSVSSAFFTPSSHAGALQVLVWRSHTFDGQSSFLLQSSCFSAPLSVSLIASSEGAPFALSLEQPEAVAVPARAKKKSE